MLHVGCGSVGLILACATSATTAHAAPASPRKIRLMSSSRSAKGGHYLLAWPGRSLVRLRDRSHAFIDEALHTRAGVRLGRVEIALRIGVEIVDAEELSRLPSA